MPASPATASPPRVVMVSLHTHPLDQAGTGDAGGMNVYIDALSRALQASGLAVDLITTAVAGRHAAPDSPGEDDTLVTLGDGRRLHTLAVPPQARGTKNDLVDAVDELAERALTSLAAVAERVDVVHSHYWISGLAGLLLAERLDAPMVHTMHTMAAVKHERDPDAAEDPRRHSAEARIVAEAQAVTANTEAEAADLRRLFDVDDARLHPLRPGVDLSVFHPPQDPDPRAELAGRPLRLAFAGRLQPHKGPQVAIEALGLFHRRMPEVPVELTIAGEQSGECRVDIAELAARHGVSELIRRRPPLPHGELAELFRASDAVLMPSCSESFGLVALEAMACGTPVLAHEVGGLRELVHHRRTGRLIGSLDPDGWAAQMHWLVLHRRAWSRYSATAAQRAREHSWEATTAPAAAALYARLAAARVLSG